MVPPEPRTPEPRTPAGPMTITYAGPQTPGESVYLLAETPLLGAARVNRAQRMVFAGGAWMLPIDAPAGADLELRFLSREDDLNKRGDNTNGSTLEVRPLRVAAAEAAPKVIRLEDLPADVRRVEAVISADEGIPFAPVTVEARRDGGAFVLAVPPEHAAQGRRFAVWVDGKELLPDVRLRVTPTPLVWKHGRFFQGTEAPPLAPAAPRVEEFPLQLPGFPDRRVRVLLPAGYDTRTAERFPVLYAQDGQNCFSPGGDFGSWDVDVAVTELARRGEIPDVIVVALDNTRERMGEYTPEYEQTDRIVGRGGEFLRGLRDVLVPLIDGRYRTQANAAGRAHLGSSLGGILGFEVATSHEDVWGSTVAMSPAFWVVQEGALKIARDPSTTFGRLYIDCGTSGPSNDDYATTSMVRDALLQRGLALGPDFHTVVAPGAVHNEGAWAQRLPDALRWLYGSL